MSVPFVITCDACHARLTVKSESLLGKRVACPSCHSPIVVSDPNQRMAEVVPEPPGRSAPETCSSVGDSAIAAQQASPLPSLAATPFVAPSISVQPTPAELPVAVSSNLAGLPVIHESAKTPKVAKLAVAGKKKSASKRKSSQTLRWRLGLAGAGVVIGLLTLVVFLVGTPKKPLATKSDTKPTISAAPRDDDAPVFDMLAPPPATNGSGHNAGTSQLTEVVEAVGDAIVCITIIDQAGQEVALGTGVLFDPAGLLATNYHVIENAASASVLFRDGTRCEVAGYRAVDAARDLAILQLAESTKPVPFLQLNPNADVQQGEDVIALGHPAGFKFTLTNGIVSAKRLSSELPAQYQQFLQTPSDQQWIQTTAAISGGNSGGPLLNARGELVGINTWVAEGENLGFAIHVRHVADLVNTISETVIALPVESQPESYRATHPLVLDLLRQFQADFEEFAVRVRNVDPQTASEVFETYNPTAAYMRRFLEFAEANRGQPAALEALISVGSLSRMTTNGSTLTAAAYERLVEDHVNDTNLRAALINAALRQDPPARAFLDLVLETSSNRELRGIAAFALASVLLASNSPDDDSEAQATQLLERVVREFGDVPWDTQSLGAVAEQVRFAAQHLAIGRAAMDLAGEDQHGNEFRLSEFQGKVVVLDFWADWCPHCRVMYPHERILVEEYAARPFVLLGVNGDEQSRFQDVANSNQVTWRSCWDGPQGSISQSWQVDSFPTIYVLDHQGIIRFKDLRDQNLTTAVRLLVNLAEVESLVAQEPDQSQHLVELGRCHGELAKAYLSLEEWRGALGQWRAAVDCFRRLAASHPEDAEYRRRFATTLVSLGQTAKRAGDSRLAAQAYREAGGAVQKAASTDANPEDRALLLMIVSQLGSVAQSQGEYAEAVKQYRAAIKFAPDSAVAMNSLAWILATCPDESIRDGAQAVLLATKACELTRWESYAMVDTLAAALAEQGQFDQAVQQQRKAVRLAPTALHASMNDRVKLYQSQMPFRLDAPLIAATSVAQPDTLQPLATPSPASITTDSAVAESASSSVAAPKTLEDAQQLLRDKGLRLSQSGVALDAELKLNQGLQEIKKDRSVLFKADTELQKLLSNEIELSGTLSTLRRQNLALNNQLAVIDPTDFALNNRLVGAVNANVSQIQLLTEHREKLGDEIKTSRGKVNAAREIYVQRILDLRKLADSARDQYEQLEGDANVQAALQVINAKSDKTFIIAASGRFKADERELKKREDKVLSESIPLRRDGGTLVVSALIGGKHTQELIVDSGASFVTLPQAMATACGIQVKSSDPTIGLQLADGSVIEGKLVTISSIRIGKFTVQDVEGVVLGPDAIAAPALLGMSFLEKFKFEIDAQQGRLTMVEVDISGP